MKKMITTLMALMIVFPMTTAMAKNSRYDRDWHGRGSYHWEGYNYGNNDSYAAVKLGAFMPNEEDDYLDNGIAFEAAIGHNVSRNFGFEVGLNYTSTDFDDNYIDEDINVNTLGIPVTAKFIVPLSNEVDFYIGGGFGVYFTNIDDHYYDDYYHESGIDDTSIGVHSVIGADFKVNPSMAFNIEVKYTEIEQDFDNSYYEDLEIGGTTAFLGVKFLF